MLAMKMRLGTGMAIEESVRLARVQAARRIQWAFRLLKFRRLCLRHTVVRAQLEARGEARKVQRKAARALHRSFARIHTRYAPRIHVAHWSRVGFAGEGVGRAEQLAVVACSTSRTSRRSRSSCTRAKPAST